VFLWRLFWASPVMAFSLCVSLVTIFWCIRFLRRRPKGWNRFVAALIGFAAICQGLRLFRQAGIVNTPGSFAGDQFADLMVTGLNLISVLILKFAAMERKTAAAHIRLAEANTENPIKGLAGFEGAVQSVHANILESNPLATIAMDRLGKVIYWNPAAERLLGWTSAEVLGKASPLPLEGPNRTKSGELLQSGSWASALRDSAGRPCGTLLIIAPVGAERQPESERVGTVEAKASFGVKHLAPVAGA
jgi:PAS domain-containing protein